MKSTSINKVNKAMSEKFPIKLNPEKNKNLNILNEFEGDVV